MYVTLFIELFLGVCLQVGRGVDDDLRMPSKFNSIKILYKIYAKEIPCVNKKRQQRPHLQTTVLISYQA